MEINIDLPLEHKCLLQPGQKVDFATPYLETKIFQEITVPIAKKLNIPSDKIFLYLKKFVGDQVEKGEILAEKKVMVGSHKIFSETSGIIKEINHEEGIIIISTPDSEGRSISSYFSGEVKAIDKNNLTLTVTHGEEFPLKAASSNFGGEVFYLKNPHEALMALNISGKVLFSETINDYLKSKSEALGVTGYITLKSLSQDSSLPDAQLKNSDHFTIIKKKAYTLCLVNKKTNKIFFYN